MQTRIEALKNLVHLNGNLLKVTDELSKFHWDSEQPLLKISKMDVSTVLKKCLDRKLSFDDIENWANAIECRDDLDFESEELKEVIHELANPKINGEINNKQLESIVLELSK